MVCNTGFYIHRKRVNWSWERRNREAWGCCIPPDDQCNRGAEESSALPSLPAIILWVPCHLLWHGTQGQAAVRGEFDNWSWFFIWCDCVGLKHRGAPSGLMVLPSPCLNYRNSSVLGSCAQSSFFPWLSALNELFFIYMWENGFTLEGCYSSWQGSYAQVAYFCV